MFFTDKKRKKNLLFSLFALTFFCGAFFLAQTYGAQAQSTTVAGAVVEAVVGNPLEFAFKGLLYAVFVFFGWIASIAVTIFGFYTDPATMGLLNRSSVYEMWKFVRDFFNLFFILTLLYIAFTVVFQINKDFKKALLSLVLAALFVNFSFPVSRFLIDATNVPMYFFANQMLTDPSKPGESFGTVLRASQLKEILIPSKMAIDYGKGNANSLTVSRLLAADIFLFLFSMTLLVLAILFANRVIFLLILVIFSSVGFAAYVIPGMSTWSKQWWDHFWKNALFGPAAMLMLLIATRFFTEIAQDQTFAQTTAAAAQNAASGEMGFIAAATMFVIPIIMLWIAMGLGQTMSITGAGAIVGLGQKASKWMGTAPFRASWAGMKWGGRKLDTHILAPKGLSPKALIGGIKGYFETQAHEDQLPIELAEGRVHNKMNRLMTILPWVHHDGVDYEFLKEQQQIRKEEAELKERSGGVINENMGRVALEEGLAEHDRNKLSAALYTLARTNGLDNVVGDFWQHYVGKQDANGDDIVKNIQTLADGTQIINISENYNAILKAMMEEVGMKDEQTQLKHIYNFGELAKASGDEVFAERATPNLKDGTFVPVTGKEHAQNAVTQMMKMRTQGLLDVMHGRVHAEQQQVHTTEIDPATGKKVSVVKRQWGDLHDLAEEWADRVSENVVNQMTRMKPEAVAAYKSMWERATSKDPEVRKTVKRFIAKYNGKNPSYRRFVLKGIGLLDKESEGNPQADPLEHTEKKEVMKDGQPVMGEDGKPLFEKVPSNRYKVAL